MERERYSAKSRTVWEVVCIRDGEEKIIEAFPTREQAEAQAEKLDREAERTFLSIRDTPRNWRDKDD
jgi:hypothetical protein